MMSKLSYHKVIEHLEHLGALGECSLDPGGLCLARLVDSTLDVVHGEDLSNALAKRAAGGRIEEPDDVWIA